MLTSITAVGTALLFSFRYYSTLRVKLSEWRRYYVKSANLALCYRGFAPNRSLFCARSAGKAAFYCCAYDVVTDWRRFNIDDQKRFKRLLSDALPPKLAAIACSLYDQERADLLTQDGLSRGIDALAFIGGLMGIDSYIRSHTNFEHLGIVMQIVDDVLDLEEDQKAGDVNCLIVTPTKRTFYLRKLTEFDLIAFRKVFPHAHLLGRVIQTAKQKAEGLLTGQDLVEKNFQLSTAAHTKT